MQICLVRFPWRAAARNGATELTGSTYSRPPHQIMIWVGLERYGYLDEAQRLAYRFLYMLVQRLTCHRYQTHFTQDDNCIRRL